MRDDQINHMVYRFLTYELPTDFSPDNGITFEPKGNVGSPYEFDRKPVGTNLLTDTQAEQMVRYLVKDMPESDETEDAGDDYRLSSATRQEWAERALKAEAERDSLRGLLEECAIDLANYVDGDYPADLRKQHPSYQRKYDRDMSLVHRIRADLKGDT